MGNTLSPNLTVTIQCFNNQWQHPSASQLPLLTQSDYEMQITIWSIPLTLQLDYVMVVLRGLLFMGVLGH